jgi:hypothetical protein
MFVATVVLLVAMAIFYRFFVPNMSRANQLTVVSVGEKVVVVCYVLAGLMAARSIATRLRQRRGPMSK